MNLLSWTTQLDKHGLNFLLHIQLEKPLSSEESIHITCDNPGFVIDPVFDPPVLKFPGTRISIPLVLSPETPEGEAIEFTVKLFDSRADAIAEKSCSIKGPVRIEELQGIPIDMTVIDDATNTNTDIIIAGNSFTAAVTVDHWPAEINLLHFIRSGIDDPLNLSDSAVWDTPPNSTSRQILVPVTTSYLSFNDYVRITLTARGMIAGQYYCWSRDIYVVRSGSVSLPGPLSHDTSGQGHICP